MFAKDNCMCKMKQAKKKLVFNGNINDFNYQYNLIRLSGRPLTLEEQKEVMKVRSLIQILPNTGTYTDKLNQGTLYTMIAQVYSKIGYLEGFILQTEYGSLIRVNYKTLMDFICYGGKVLDLNVCADGRLSMNNTVRKIVN